MSGDVQPRKRKDKRRKRGKSLLRYFYLQSYSNGPLFGVKNGFVFSPPPRSKQFISFISIIILSSAFKNNFALLYKIIHLACFLSLCVCRSSRKIYMHDMCAGEEGGR